MHGLAVRYHLYRREHVEAADGQHDEGEEYGRLYAWQSYVEEPGEGPAAVDGRGLIELLRHALQCGEEHD